MGDLPGDESGEGLVEPGNEGIDRGREGRDGERDLRVKPGAIVTSYVLVYHMR